MYQDIGKAMLVGSGHEIHEVPAQGLIEAMQRLPERMAKRLAFMTREHHLVRDFVVREMPRQSQPIPPARIAQCTGLEPARVTAIVAELEKNLFFLVRDRAGNVSWAFPVTTAVTAHRLTFSSGEKTSGAWAEDAFATPFVQGRLRGEKLRVRIDSECRHCSRPLRLEVDEELRWEVLSPGATPLLFEPDMDWESFRGANIIHDYWNQTVFFWSEEHARAYRQKQAQPDGAYLTPAQVAFSERIAQAGLFAFPPTGPIRRWELICRAGYRPVK